MKFDKEYQFSTDNKKRKTTLDWLVLFFVVSSVLGVAVSYSKLYLFHISYMFLLFYLLLTFNKNKSILVFKNNLNYIVFFMVFFIWYFISILWSISSIEYSFQYLFYILMGVSISCVIIFYINSKKNLIKVYKILSVIFMIEIILSLLELHPDFMLPIAPSSTIVEYFGRTMASNNPTILTGFNWNQNNLAVVMVMILPFCLFYKRKVIKIVLTLAIFLIVYKTDSRGGQLALIIIFGIYCMIDKKRLIYSILGILILVNVVSYTPYKNLILNKTMSLYETARTFIFDKKNATESVLLRQRLINNELLALKESNYLGVGIGGSLEVQKRAGGVYKNLGEKDFDYYKKIDAPIFNMHSFLIEILVDGGIVFFSIFLIWYLYVLRKLYVIIRNGTETLKYYANASFLSMIAFVLCTFTPSSMIYILPIWVLFGFVMGVIKIGDINNEENTITI